jgi:salicylate hydroxylase
MDAAVQVQGSEGLRILVVGAGIAGLTAALALRRQGHQVIVFEKSKLAYEIGAAIHAAPNSARLLRRLGFEPREHGGTAFEDSALFDEKGNPQSGTSLHIPHSVHESEVRKHLRGRLPC